MSLRGCKQDANWFYYICDEFNKIREEIYDWRKNLKICEAYQVYINPLVKKNQHKT